MIEMGEPSIEKQRPLISLKRVTAADIETYTELEKTRTGLPTYHSMTNTEEAAEQIEKSINYFIKHGDDVVGSISYRVDATGSVEIDGLLIKPEAEGKGYAKAAILEILEELKGYKHIWLLTHPDNARSIPLYLSCGFTIRDRKENVFGDGEPRLVLELNK